MKTYKLSTKIMLLVFLTLFFAAFALITGCNTSKKTSYTERRSESVLDSSWTEKKPVDVPVKGSATPAVNFDSLMSVMRSMFVQFNDDNIPVVVPAAINKTYYIPDSSGKLFLKYWVDSMGNLMAQCEAKDQVIRTLVDQNNRIIKERSTFEVEDKKVVTRLPIGFYIGLVVFAILVIAAVIYTR